MTLSKRFSVALVACISASTHAFSPAIISRGMGTTAESSDTALHAFAPPTLIIGPMIRRMKEEQEKKKMPMAAANEAKNEAPGLRVGANAWKWPPVWPYDSNFFKRRSEMNAKNQAAPLNMLTGQMPSPDAAEDENEFNSLKYWEENSSIKTDLDPKVAEKIKK